MPDTKKIIKDNYIFGLDIGTRSVVGIVGRKTAGSFNIIADYILEHDTRSMIDGQIHDVAKVIQTIQKVKSELENIVGFPLKKVCIAAAGRVLKTTSIHVEQNIDPNIVIDKDRIYTIELVGIEKAHQEINDSLTEEESGYHCVGYSVSNYYLNDYEIANLQGHKGKKFGADVLATFLPKEVIESLYYVVSKAGMEVQSLTLEPIAAIDVAIPPQYRLLNIALVDIGAGTSDIAITKEGSIIAYGMIPIAGDEVTELIAHSYLVDFKTAEKIKIKSSGKSKSITFKDIIGIKHKIDLDEVNDKIKPALEKLAESISSKIIELNSNYPTNAVFIVGGGGQLKGFTEILAKFLDIPKERVALRGKSVLQTVTFESETKKGPELVTPIGICYSGMDSNKHDFMQVFLNDEPLRVFNTNHLTVMDIAAFKGFNPKKLIARRGNDLTFKFNDIEKVIKGRVGEPARILINNKEASLTDKVVMNDYIAIIPAKKGRNGSLSTKKLIEETKPIEVFINDNYFTVKPSLTLNGKPISINYDIHKGDKIDQANLVLKDVLKQCNINYSGKKVTVNNDKKPLDYVINHHDIINVENDSEEKSIIKKVKDETITREQDNKAIIVNVNGDIVHLKGKDNYVFVDIFDYIDFDLTQPKGAIQCEVNNEKATYMQPIKDSDIIKVYWNNEK